MRIFSQTFVSASIALIDFVTIYSHFFTKFFIIQIKVFVKFLTRQKRALYKGLFGKMINKGRDDMLGRPLLS